MKKLMLSNLGTVFINSPPFFKIMTAFRECNESALNYQ